jgi:hypothetical protein
MGWLLFDDSMGGFIYLSKSNLMMVRFCIPEIGIVAKTDYRRLVEWDTTSCGAFLSATSVDLIFVGLIVGLLFGDALIFLLSVVRLHSRLMALLVSEVVFGVVLGWHRTCLVYKYTNRLRSNVVDVAKTLITLSLVD